MLENGQRWISGDCLAGQRGGRWQIYRRVCNRVYNRLIIWVITMAGWPEGASQEQQVFLLRVVMLDIDFQARNKQ